MIICICKDKITHLKHLKKEKNEYEGYGNQELDL